MTEDAKPKPKLVTPSDALDLSDLWLDPGLGDGITERSATASRSGKPRDYFRMHPDPAYRRLVEIYKHKTEDAIEEEYFVFAGGMKGMLEEAAPTRWLFASIATAPRGSGRCDYPRKASVTTMHGPRRELRPGRRSQSGSSCCGRGGRSLTREAKPGYAPDPAWEKLPPFEELMIKAFGEKNIIRDSSHSMYRNLIGDKPTEEMAMGAGTLIGSPRYPSPRSGASTSSIIPGADWLMAGWTVIRSPRFVLSPTRCDRAAPFGFGRMSWDPSRLIGSTTVR